MTKTRWALVAVAVTVLATWLAWRRLAPDVEEPVTAPAETVTPAETPVSHRPPPPRKRVSTRLRERCDVTPFSVFIAAIFLIPGGVLAIIFGSRTSAAITAVLPGALIPHLWGAFLVVAGVTVLVGIARGNWLLEFAGLRLGSAGVGFYAACLFLGLGLRGVEAGLLCTAVGLSKLYRARYLRHTTKTYRFAVSTPSPPGR